MTTAPTFFTILALALGPAAFAQSGDLCFDDAKVAQIAQAIPGMAMTADKLAMRQIDAGADGKLAYMLARQVTILERLHRRLLVTGEIECYSALDAIRRDLAVAIRIVEALEHGDAELGIAELEDTLSREMLNELEEQLKMVEALVATFVLEP